jgi:hypothetical protein
MKKVRYPTVNIIKQLKIEVILLDVIDGSAPLIPCKDGNLRLFIEQKKKKRTL